jgi:hypothetical protein
MKKKYIREIQIRIVCFVAGAICVVRTQQLLLQSDRRKVIFLSLGLADPPGTLVTRKNKLASGGLAQV